MKKALIGLAVSVMSFALVPAHAADSKALVIIDSYFDSRAAGAKIVCAPTLNCSTTVTPTTTMSDPVNHGDAMAEVAIRQNPNINLILVRSTESASNMTGLDLIRSLQWVEANSTNVGAVSFSRSISNNANNGNCQLSSTGLNIKDSKYPTVALADAEIKRLILSLKSKGIPFFASTGNKSNTMTSVGYPACLAITSSVTANNYNSALSNSDTDFIGSLPSNELYTTNYKSRVSFDGKSFSIPQTTSSATAAVAAKWVVTGGFIDKVVSVLS